MLAPHCDDETLGPGGLIPAAVYAARDPQASLWACAETRDTAAEDIHYSLSLKALTMDGVVSYASRTLEPKPGEGTASRSGAFFCTQVSLADLGDPWAIFLGAEVDSPEANLPYDRAAWQMLLIR